MEYIDYLLGYELDGAKAKKTRLILRCFLSLLSENLVLMEHKGFFVVFIHENEEFILRNEQLVLSKYYREFYGERVVQFDSKFSHLCVKMFFKFLQVGIVPENVEDQIIVFQLLKEWDCHFLIFDSYLVRIQSQMEKKMKEPKDKRKMDDLILLFNEMKKTQQDIGTRKKDDEKSFGDEIHKAEQMKNEPDQEIIEEWKSTKPTDFEENIFEAAKVGKLTSVKYLLTNGTGVNTKDYKIGYFYMIKLLFI